MLFPCSKECPSSPLFCFLSRNSNGFVILVYRRISGRELCTYDVIYFKYRLLNALSASACLALSSSTCRIWDISKEQ